MVFTDPNNYPIEIHCTQGKDRTGMVSAFILSIAGVPEDIIVSDYAKTQKGLVPVYREMLEDVRRAGLSDDFAEAPPQVIRVKDRSCIDLQKIVHEGSIEVFKRKVWIDRWLSGYDWVWKRVSGTCAKDCLCR